jgi:Zn-finger nucleic acid-binding protein
MNCLNCGAGLRPVGNRSYFRCPYCQTFHFPEETGDGVAVVGDETPHACPVCTHPLTGAAIEGHSVAYCQTCRGFLARNDTFGQIVRLRRAKHGSPAHIPVPFDRAELRRRINCPRCSKLMDTHPYHAGGNAVIDTCHRCRLVWLDAGELTVLGRYPTREKPLGSQEQRLGSPVDMTAPDPVPGSVIDLLGFHIRLS